jgi:leader peptidase (prepilin peptidase) / N-methyltransferase
VLIVAAAAGAGALAGAALPVPAYRLSVDRGCRAECASCATALGWLRLGGRCPGCGTRLGPRTWVLSALSAAVCAALAWRFGASYMLVPYAAAGVLGVLLAAIDLASQRLPDALVLPGCVALAVAFGLLALVGGGGGWSAWGRALAAGLGYAVGYLVLALLPGGQLGLGDVKLGLLLGVCLGWLGWPVLVSGAVLPWLVNAPVAIVVLLRRRRGAAGLMPFGPAMLVGAFVAVVAPPALAALLHG